MSNAAEAVQPLAASVDPLVLRRTCGSFGTGVTVITTRDGGVDHGMTANSFMSVSLDPSLILVSIDRRAKILKKIESAGRYAVSVLSAEMIDIAMHFAGKPRERLACPFVDFGGLPVVRGALAHLVARLQQAIPAGDHVLYLGAVEHLNGEEGRPLIFHGGRFCPLPETSAPLGRAQSWASWGALRQGEDFFEIW